MELENLEYNTAKENVMHAERIGLRNSKGIGNANSKLKEHHVIMIKEDFETGLYSQEMLAEAYGISKSAISSIIRGRNWSHLN